MSQSPRLMSFLGSQVDLITKDIEMQDPKAMTIVKLHYSSQSFESKHDGYWEKAPKPDIFRAHLFKWCTLCGTAKDNLPDEVEIELIKESLLKSYPYMNENSVTDALHKNLAGEMGERVVMFYNKFNAKYLYDVLCQYDGYLRAAHKLAVDAKNKNTEIMNPPEPTPEEIEVKMKITMNELFAEFKRTQDFNILSAAAYDYMDRNGYLKLTADEKRQYFKDAGVYLSELTDKHAGLKTLKQLMTDVTTEADKKEAAVLIAKRLSLKAYFNSIEKLPF